MTDAKITSVSYDGTNQYYEMVIGGERVIVCDRGGDGRIDIETDDIFLSDATRYIRKKDEFNKYVQTAQSLVTKFRRDLQNELRTRFKNPSPLVPARHASQGEAGGGEGGGEGETDFLRFTTSKGIKVFISADQWLAGAKILYVR